MKITGKQLKEDLVYLVISIELYKYLIEKKNKIFEKDKLEKKDKEKLTEINKEIDDIFKFWKKISKDYYINIYPYIIYIPRELKMLAEILTEMLKTIDVIEEKNYYVIYY